METAFLKLYVLGNSLAVQWLGLRAFTAKGPGEAGSIPGWGTISQKPCSVAKKKKKMYVLYDPMLKTIWNVWRDQHKF